MGIGKHFTKKFLYCLRQVFRKARRLIVINQDVFLILISNFEGHETVESD